MYREDTSTSSSEDEASTTAAAASTTTTTTTADMCRSEVRNGEKVQRCTGCGYTSDRRANVTRHYRRIHTVLKREKYRRCPCGDVFQTKWEFYNHCDEHHPSLRQSWFTTTHVYKLKQTKAKVKQEHTNVRPRAKSDQSYRASVKKGLATRSSTRRLRSQGARSTSNSESSASSFSLASETSSAGTSTASFTSASNKSSRKESSYRSSESEDTGYENSATSFSAFCSSKSEDTGYGNSATSYTGFHTSESEDTNDEKPASNFAVLKTSESEDTNDEKPASNFVVFKTSESEDTNDEKPASNFVVFKTSESEDTCDENAMSSFAHLPIKKRYMESVRKVLGDITNRVSVEVQKVNSENKNNSAPMSVRDLYLLNMNEKQRAFIAHIDFDELDAILKLRDMKKAM